jgi:hypothetical protein
MRNLNLTLEDSSYVSLPWQFKMECWGSYEGVCKVGWNGYTLPFFSISRVLASSNSNSIHFIKFVKLEIQFNWNLYQHWVCDANVAKCDKTNCMSLRKPIIPKWLWKEL